MIYEIFEGNMERLEKKLNTIRNKCQVYGCEFSFEVVGEVFHEVDSETLRFVQVEASGIARVNGWEFVATIEHNNPMNVIRAFRTEYEIPERYYTSAPICEHCNSKRNRKDTYLIRNTDTGEFKQVGKSCLRDFTKGLDANLAAWYASWFDELENANTPSLSGGYTVYYKVSEVIQAAVEAVNIYGYQKSGDSWEGYQNQTTKQVVFDVLNEDVAYKKHLDKGFNYSREGNKEKTQAILSFVASLPQEYGYISNLKVLCSNEYCQQRDVGIIASSVACYDREQKKQERMAKEKEAKLSSIWVGKEGERLTLNNLSVKLLTSWETLYGFTFMYQFTDEAGNVYIWKTGNIIEETRVSLKGTVKAHGEFNGIKQTELTRCRVN